MSEVRWGLLATQTFDVAVNKRTKGVQMIRKRRKKKGKGRGDVGESNNK